MSMSEMVEAMLSDRVAEKGLLGAVMLSDDRTLWVTLSGVVKDKDFFDPANAIIWQAQGKIVGRGDTVDVITLANELKSGSRLNAVGGAHYLGELTDNIATVAYADQWARIVADLATRRRVAEAAASIQSKAETCCDVGQLTEHATGALRNALGSNTKATSTKFRDALQLALQELEKTSEGRGSGVSTSIPALDRFAGKFRPAEVSFIAARTGDGKTTLAMQIAMALAATGVPVTYFSLEMPTTEILLRQACYVEGVTMADVEAGKVPFDRLNRIFAEAERISHLPITIEFGDRPTALEMMARVQRAMLGEQIGLVIVDHLQLMKHASRADGVAEKYADTVNCLKEAAISTGVPWLVLSQFNRTGGKAEGAPKREDMYGSSAIEQIASKVFILHDNKVIVDKNRGGRTGPLDVTYDRAHGRFLAAEDAVAEVATRPAPDERGLDDFPSEEPWEP